MSEPKLIQEVHAVGWVECKLEFCNKMFFRHEVGDRRYSLSDKIGVCPLCISEIQRKNDTVKGTTATVGGERYHNKSWEAKPGSDTL